MTEKINSILENYLRNIPSLIFFLVPVFFLTNSIDPFALNKFYLVNVIATISIVVWAIRNVLTNKISITLSPATTSLFLLIVVHLASTYFMSPTKVLSLTGITTLLVSCFLIHLSYTSVETNQRSLEISKLSLLASTIIVSLHTVFQYFGLNEILFPSQIISQKNINLTGSLMSGLIFTVPIIVGLVTETIKLAETNKKVINIIITSILATATTINLLNFYSPTNRSLPGLPLSTSWSIALDIFKYPGTALIGTGPENYLQSFTRLRPANLNLNDNLWNIRFSESGSLFLTFVTTTGLLGGFFLIYPFFKHIRIQLKKNTNKSENHFFTATLITFFLTIFFTPVGITSIIVSFTILGILAQSQRDTNPSTVKPLHLSLSNDGQSENTLSKFLPLGSLIILITLLATYWNFGGRFYFATIKIYQANKIANIDLSESFKKQVEAQQLNPYDSTYSIILSKTYQQMALFYLQKQSPTENDKKNSTEMMQRSIDSARLAAKIDPFNVLVWENLSTIYQSFMFSAEGANNLAIAHLAQAISLDPTNPRLRLQLGILYYNLQDKDQAIKLISQASELKPNWYLPYENLYRIYKEEKNFAKAKAYLEQSLKNLDNNSETSQKLQTELIELNKNI